MFELGPFDRRDRLVFMCGDMYITFIHIKYTGTLYIYYIRTGQSIVP